MPDARAELFEKIDRGWDELDQLVVGATATRLTAVGDAGWSVKDHLAHLTVWECRLLAFLDGQGFNAYFGLEDGSYKQLGIDGLNARIFEQQRGRSLDDVLADWRSTHQRVRERLERADLLTPVPDPDDPADVEPLVSSGAVIGNTWDHYREHAPMMRALLA